MLGKQQKGKIMVDFEAIEKEKKMTRIFYKTANIAGYGIGGFVLAFLLPFINKNSPLIADLSDLFIKYSWMALGCVVLMLATFLFSRKHVMAVHQLLYWVILPSIAIMMAIDVFTTMTANREVKTIELNIPISDEGLLE